jgi:hypothetical protein
MITIPFERLKVVRGGGEPAARRWKSRVLLRPRITKPRILCDRQDYEARRKWLKLVIYRHLFHPF